MAEVLPESVTEADIHKRLDKVEKDGREANRKLQALRDQLEEDKAKEKALEQKIQVGLCVFFSDCLDSLKFCSHVPYERYSYLELV